MLDGGDRNQSARSIVAFGGKPRLLKILIDSRENLAADPQGFPAPVQGHPPQRASRTLRAARAAGRDGLSLTRAGSGGRG